MKYGEVTAKNFLQIFALFGENPIGCAKKFFENTVCISNTVSQPAH